MRISVLFCTTLLLSVGAAFAQPQLAIREIQFTSNPNGDSPYLGQTVSTTGVVTAVTEVGYVIQDPAADQWGAVWVYDPEHRPVAGDRITLTGEVNEYYSLTQLWQVSAYQRTPWRGGRIEPVVVTAGSIVDGSQTTEAHESMLVRIEGVRVTQNPDEHGYWKIADETGEAFVGDVQDYLYRARAGDTLSHVTGPLMYSWGEFRIEPRSEDDIGRLDVAPFALHGAVVLPDGVRDDGYVIVRGRRIEAVGGRRPRGMPVLETGGTISPGLIDAHNHPAFGIFGPLEFGTTFRNREEWRAMPLYDAFYDTYAALRDAGLSPQMWKYSEVRALIWGATSMQGAYWSNSWDWGAYAHAGVLVRNPERWPGRVAISTFPLDDLQQWAPVLRDRIDDGVYRAVMIHLSEGIDGASLQEFWTWKGAGVLDPTTAIIHGIPYGQTEFDAMAQAGASLVWSPRSNLRLYGRTVDVPAAVQAGVPIALGADWTPTGSPGILAELALADSLNRTMYGRILSDRQLVDMVTANAADAFGRDEDLGRIAPGYLADLTVVTSRGRSPYRDLIEAGPLDVRLVLVGGRAVYGLASLMDTLYGSSDGTAVPTRRPAANLESLTFCDGVERKVQVRSENPGIPFHEEGLREVTDLLLNAYPDLYPLAPCLPPPPRR